MSVDENTKRADAAGTWRKVERVRGRRRRNGRAERRVVTRAQSRAAEWRHDSAPSARGNVAPLPSRRWWFYEG
jgi:hypothetical protein